MLELTVKIQQMPTYESVPSFQRGNNYLPTVSLRVQPAHFIESPMIDMDLLSGNFTRVQKMRSNDCVACGTSNSGPRANDGLLIPRLCEEIDMREGWTSTVVMYTEVGTNAMISAIYEAFKLTCTLCRHHQHLVLQYQRVRCNIRPQQPSPRFTSCGAPPSNPRSLWGAGSTQQLLAWSTTL